MTDVATKTIEGWQALAEQAAAELEGTCKSLSDLGEEFEGAENVRAFTDRLDEIVFLCDGCGWWCEIGELVDRGAEQFCEGCAEDTAADD